MRKEAKILMGVATATSLAISASGDANQVNAEALKTSLNDNILFVDNPQDPDFQQFEPTPTPTLTVTTEPNGGRLRGYPNAGDSNNIISEVPSNTQLEVLGYLNTNSQEGNNPDYWFWARVTGSSQMVWVNQLVIPGAVEIDQATQVPHPKGDIPNLIDVAQIQILQNNQILVDQSNQPVRLLEYNYQIGNTIDYSKLVSVWGDRNLPQETYNPANLAVADNLGEVIVQTRDILRPDGGVNPAGSVILLPEVTLPDGSQNIQPLFLDKAEIQGFLGREVNFNAVNSAEGTIRMSSDSVFLYGRFAQDRISGVNVNTAFAQNTVVWINGDLPNSSFTINAEFTRVTFTTGEIFDLALGDDGYLVATKSAEVALHVPYSSPEFDMLGSIASFSEAPQMSTRDGRLNIYYSDRYIQEEHGGNNFTVDPDLLSSVYDRILSEAIVNANRNSESSTSQLTPESVFSVIPALPPGRRQYAGESPRIDVSLTSTTMMVVGVDEFEALIYAFKNDEDSLVNKLEEMGIDTSDFPLASPQFLLLAAWNGLTSDIVFRGPDGGLVLITKPIYYRNQPRSYPFAAPFIDGIGDLYVALYFNLTSIEDNSVSMRLGKSFSADWIYQNFGCNFTSNICSGIHLVGSAN